MADFDKPSLESFGEVSRWTFPARQLPEHRSYGWLGVAAGAFGCLFMCAWMAMPGIGGIMMLIKGQWFGGLMVGFAALGLGGLWGALKILTGGLAVVRDQTYCVVELNDSTLSVREYLGLSRFKRELEIDQIQSLRLGRSSEKKRADRPRAGRRTAGWSPNLPGAIELAAVTTAADKSVLIGYPEELTREFAEDLLGKLKMQQRTLQLLHRHDDPDAPQGIDRSRSSVAKPKLALVDRDAPEESVPLKPIGSRILEHERDGGLVYEVPAVGIWKSNGGLMLFAVLWNGFMVVFTSVTIGALFQGKQQNEVWVIALFLSLFWAVGLGLMAAAILRGTRKTLLGVLDGMLFIETKSVFGRRWRDVALSQVQSIDVGPSGMEINDVPVFELKIATGGDKDIGLLSEVSDEELDWLAYRLREEIGVDAFASGGWQGVLANDEALSRPPSESASLEGTPSGQRISLDRPGIGGTLVGVVFGGVFLCIGIAVMVSQFVPGGPLAALSFLPGLLGLVFAAVGFAIFSGAVWYGSRRYEIHLSPSELRIEQIGVLGRKTHRWESDEIRRVEVVDSGMKVNEVPQLRLEIESSDGGITKMMTGRKEAELNWIVAHVHQVVLSAEL